MQLERILKTPTSLLIGMGVAIGSGIFRTPGLVAQSFQAPWLIALGWLFGGAFVLMSGMVSAELATRHPRAGGEYVYLREAYGEFAAFFFGWAYTALIIGVGVATIAAALGDFGCELFGWPEERSGYVAAAAVIVVTLVNSLGLRAGAGWQNALTLAKIGALLALVAVSFARGGEPIEFWSAPVESTGGPLLAVFAAGMIPILWAYEGSTDAVKLAEEIKDVRRAMPRALIGSALALTVLYVAVNLALLRMVPVREMAGVTSVPGEALGRLFGPPGRRAMLIVAMLVCLGALSSTLLATVRVTYALARDGLAFRFMSRMSAAQAPVPALVVVGGLAVVLVLKRSFVQVLGIYAFAAAILFGLAYASLIVFRLRDRGEFPPGAYRCPAGPMLAGILILIQLALAVGIAINSPADAFYTSILMVGVAALYALWKKRPRPAPPPGM